MDSAEIIEYVRARAVVAYDNGEYLFALDPAVFNQYETSLPVMARYTDADLEKEGVKNIMIFYNGVDNPVAAFPFQGGRGGFDKVLEKYLKDGLQRRRHGDK